MYYSIDFSTKILNLSEVTLHSSTNFGPIYAHKMCLNIYLMPVTLTVN